MDQGNKLDDVRYLGILFTILGVFAWIINQSIDLTIVSGVLFFSGLVLVLVYFTLSMKNDPTDIRSLEKQERKELQKLEYEIEDNKT